MCRRQLRRSARYSDDLKVRNREGFRTPAPSGSTAHTRPASETLHESGHPSTYDLTDGFDTKRPFYSITSSARARIDGGMVRPRVLAVLRLTTSSKLVGCCTGRSAGLAPLRILPA